MRIRLCALLFGLGIMLVMVGWPLPPNQLGPRTPIGFAPPETILDGSAYSVRMHPHYSDFDGDGVVDQLIGADDRLLIMRNRGTNAKPDYEPPTYFDAVESTANLPRG